VGVQGDGRTYSNACALTAKNQKPNWDHLFYLAQLIPKICHKVNRVIFVYGPPLLGPLTEISNISCTPDIINTLQNADDLVTQVLVQTDQIHKIAQAPVIIFPFGDQNRKSIAFRPIITNDFMTGRAARPGLDLTEESITEIQQRVTNLPGVDRFAYDLTSKPPGTTEWE